MVKKTLKIEVYGRVQGVNFRNMTKNFADALELRGFVMNRDDGSVEIVAHGNDEGLRKLIEWIKKSPGFSEVEKIKIKSREIRDELRLMNFYIKRNSSFFDDKIVALKNLGKKLVKTD